MLLCDEKELLQSLAHYGLLSHTINGQLQSVRGIGAIIYITDKVNISANARRTFIEVTDNDSLKFLRLLSDFIDIIYDTRYSLSNYLSFVEKQNNDKEKWTIIVGSSNISGAAFKKNVEWNILNHEPLSENNEPSEFSKSILEEFDKLWKSPFSKDFSAISI